MQNKILIEGDDKGTNYSIMCKVDFLVQAIVNLYNNIIEIDSDGHIAMHVLAKIKKIAEDKYLRGDKDV